MNRRAGLLCWEFFPLDQGSQNTWPPVILFTLLADIFPVIEYIPAHFQRRCLFKILSSRALRLTDIGCVVSCQSASAFRRIILDVVYWELESHFRSRVDR
jgi:hypothetical protein